jgi:hypothetical protein
MGIEILESAKLSIWHRSELRAERNIGPSNPTVPIFGLIDYPVTPHALRRVAERFPELSEDVVRFILGTSDFGSFSRLSATKKFPATIALAPPISVVTEDVRKWAAFIKSGQQRTLAFMKGQWVLLGPNGRYRNCDTDTFQINSRKKDDPVVLDGSVFAIQDRFPDDWRAMPWAKVRIVMDDGDVMGDVYVVATWKPEANRWCYDGSDGLKDVGLAGVVEALRRDLFADWHDHVNSIVKSRHLTVQTIHISNGLLVIDEHARTVPAERVSLNFFTHSLQRFAVELDTFYRPLFESPIRIFCNERLKSTGLININKVVDVLLAGMPTLASARSFGAKPKHGTWQIEKMYQILGRIHNCEKTARIKMGVSSPVVTPRERDDIKPTQPLPERLNASAVEELRVVYECDAAKGVKGAFFKQWEPRFLFDNKEAPETASTIMLDVHSLPTDDIISGAIAHRPDAETVMRAWRAIWDRSFPSWQEGKSGENPLSPLRRRHSKWLSKALSDAEGGALCSNTVASVDFVLRMDYSNDAADWASIINDASAVVEMTSRCIPRTLVMKTPAGSFIVSGFDSDEMPLLEKAFDTISIHRHHYRLFNRKLDYLNWPFLMKHLGRTLAHARTRTSAALTLLDMKTQGYSDAIVTDHESWHNFDLARSADHLDFKRRINAAFGSEVGQQQSFFITENVVLTGRQRFFLVDGRVAASACCDCSLTALDAQECRLDSRVVVPVGGKEGRAVADRAAAALLARKARSVAIDLRANGVLECAFDLALSDRGPMLIWLTSLELADRGTLSMARFIAAFERKRNHLRQPICRELSRRINSLVSNEMASTAWLNKACHDVIDRNLHNLPEVIEYQYDVTSDYSLPDKYRHPDYMGAAAASVILTALMEFPSLSVDIAAISQDLHHAESRLQSNLRFKGRRNRVAAS